MTCRAATGNDQLKIKLRGCVAPLIVLLYFIEMGFSMPFTCTKSPICTKDPYTGIRNQVLVVAVTVDSNTTNQ